MEAKRNSSRTSQRPSSKTQVLKNGSEVSLTPSQAADQARNGNKHPFDALSKPSKLFAVERRSGLQDVNEEYLKQNVFRKPLNSQYMAQNETNCSQNQVVNQQAAGGQLVNSTSEGYVQNQAPIKQQQPIMMKMKQPQQQLYNQQHSVNQIQQQQHQQPITNATPSQIQMQPQVHNSTGFLAQQQNQQAMNTKNIIIHSGTTPTKGGAESGSFQTSAVEIINENLQNLNVSDHEETEHDSQPQQQDVVVDADLITSQTDVEQPSASAIDTTELEINIGDNAANELEQPQSQQNSSVNTPSQPSKGTSIFEMENRKTAPPTFHLSKQHTGMKNRSYGVGLAVTPSPKMEFDQESREDFGVVKINRPIGKQPLSPNANEETMSTVSSSAEGLTDQGYYDLKFYHNKLW